MKKIVKLLSTLNLVLMLTTYLSIVTAQDKFPAVALAHDGESFDLIDVHAMRDLNYIFKIILFACPGQSKQPGEVDERETESSLIIEKIHNAPFGSLYDRICETECKPNIQYDSKERSYMIGYKFYINDIQLKTISNAINKEPEDLSSENRIEISDGRLTRTHENSYWVVLMNIDILPNWSKVSEHTVDIQDYNGDFQNCKDLNLGLSFIDNYKDLEKAYEKENQLSMLNKFMIPSLTENEAHKRYLIKQQLTPMNDFDSLVKRLATCSLLNTAPMWKTIAEGAWKGVEDFIKKISDYGEIEVTTGIYGSLEVTEAEAPYDRKKVLLNNSPVPEVFWKFVKNRVADDNQLIEYRGILIFTYNYISGTELHRPFCSENVCRKFGWDVENDEYKTGFTYCCSGEKKIMKKLGMEYMSPISDFELRTDSREDAFDEDDENIDMSEEPDTEERLPVI